MLQTAPLSFFLPDTFCSFYNHSCLMRYAETDVEDVREKLRFIVPSSKKCFLRALNKERNFDETSPCQRGLSCGIC